MHWCLCVCFKRGRRGELLRGKFSKRTGAWTILRKGVAAVGVPHCGRPRAPAEFPPRKVKGAPAILFDVMRVMRVSVTQIDIEEVEQ